jgi:hypothetical protein
MPKICLDRREPPLKYAWWIFDPAFPVLTLSGGLKTLKNPKIGSKAENKGQKTTE